MRSDGRGRGAERSTDQETLRSDGGASPDAALALLTGDVEFVVPGPASVGAAGVGRGHAAVEQCLRTLRQGQQTLSVDIKEFVAEADRVVVLLHVTARVLATGRVFESDIIHFFSIKDGKVSRLLEFFDTAALAAAHRV